MSAPVSLPVEEEAARLRVLDSFDAGKLEDDPELQAIVRFAAGLCGVSASMVSLVERERQHFLAREGITERETPRDVSFCVHALESPGILEVVDAARDERFADNPLVTGPPFVRYYAGHPLVSEEGATLGTLCVIDVEARPAGLTEFQREGLAVLAQAAMRRLKSRREELRGEERFQALADSMPAIAFSADSDGNIDYLNRRWNEFTGCAEGLDPGKRRETLHPDERRDVVSGWLQAVRTGEFYERENRLRTADGEWRWVLTRARAAGNGPGGSRRWFGTMTDIHEVHRLSEARDMLARELSHRIKNIFAVVTGLITLRARKSPENKPFADMLVETLRALGRAHEYVRPGEGSARESLFGLLSVIFAPYCSDGETTRVKVRGSDATVGPRSATPLALVFHELATNSTKYGALSADDGHVDLVIETDAETVRLTWTELGGPRPVHSDVQGFGSRMVEMAVTGQLQGTLERHFEPDGLVVELTLSQAAITP